MVRGRNGLLFDREDAKGLAACMARLLRDETLRTSVAFAGKSSAGLHDIDLSVTQHFDMYEIHLNEISNRLANRRKRRPVDEVR